MRQNNSGYIASPLLIAASFVAMITGLYLYATAKSQVPSVAIIPAISTAPSLAPVLAHDPSLITFSHIKSFPHFLISYPQGWKILDDKGRVMLSKKGLTLSCLTSADSTFDFTGAPGSNENIMLQQAGLNSNPIKVTINGSPAEMDDANFKNDDGSYSNNYSLSTQILASQGKISCDYLIILGAKHTTLVELQPYIDEYKALVKSIVVKQ